MKKLKPNIKFLNVLVSTACLAIICISMLAMYWLLWPYKVLEYKQNPIPVLKEVPKDLDDLPERKEMLVFKPGDKIVLIHDYCRFRESEITGTLELVDSVKLSIPFKPTQSKVGCQKRASLALSIPEFFESEEPVVFHFTLNYKVNPIRTITYHIETEKFLVRK